MSQPGFTQFPSLRAAIAVAVAILTAQSTSAQTLFDNVRVDHPLSVTPFAGTSADFDGNGVIDLAFASSSSSSVSIHLANGSSGFAFPTTISVPGTPRGIAAGDVDGDGDVDLAVALNLSGGVRLLMNNGTGTFTSGALVSTGGSPLAVALANLDGGADLELVLGTDMEVRTYANNGSGVFTLSSTSATAGFVLQVTAGDLNGDGMPDVAGSQTGALGLFHIMTDGSGALGACTNVTAGTNAQGVCIADVDGDLENDITVANRGSNSITVHLNTGSGSFAPASVVPAAGNPWSVVATDLDSDGDSDIVYGGDVGSNGTVLENAGGGTFVTRATVKLAGGGVWVGVSDWDDDGVRDFAFGCNYAVSLFHGTGLAMDVAERLPGATPRIVASADIDGDGDLDLLSRSATSGQVRITRNDGAGGWEPQSNHIFGGANTRAFLVQDITGDGFPDMMAGGLASNLSVAHNDGSGAFLNQPNLSVAGQPAGFATGDFDGDGDPDIAASLASASGVRLLINDGSGTFSLGATIPVGAGPGGIASGDIDGDSDIDLVVSCNASDQIAVLANDGSGAFTTTMFSVGDGPGRLAFGDLDGDGDIDIAVPFEGSDLLGLYANNGTGTLAVVSIIPARGTPQHATICDADGDGDRDVLVTCLLSGNVRFYNNFGGFVFGELPGYEAEPGAIMSVVADFDDNGSPEVATANEAQNTVTILRNSIPSVESVDVVSDSSILVTFTEEVTDEHLQAASYSLSGSAKGSLAANPANVSATGTGQRLLQWTIGEMYDGGDATISISGSITDLRGNKVGHVKTRTHVGGGHGYNPVADFQSPGGPYTTVDTFDVELVFSEKLDAFSDTALVITGAEFQGWDVNEPTYTIHLRATSEGPVTVELPAGSYTDLAGNVGLDAESITVTYDATPPDVVLSSTAPDPTNAAIAVTATVTEPTISFTADDVSGNNATVSGFVGSGSSYSWTLTPLAQGNFSCSVAASTFTDGALHPNTASNTLPRVFDSIAPGTFLSTSAPNPTNAPLGFTVILGESSTNFTGSDVVVTNGSVAGFTGSGTNYSWSVTPAAQGAVTCRVPAGVYTDAAGNANTASGMHTRIYDSVAPTISISSAAPDPTNASIAVSATTSEATTSFSATDVSVTNATVGGFSGSGTSYSWTLVPTSQGLVSCQVNAGVFADAATNTNDASGVFTRMYDSVAPSITLTCTAPDPTNEAITVQALLSEPSIDFAAGDIAVSNATISGFSGSGTSFSWTLTAAGEGLFSCEVPAGTFADAAANVNSGGSNTIARTYDATAPTLSLTTIDPTRVGPDPVVIDFEVVDTGSGFGSGQAFVRQAGEVSWSPFGGALPGSSGTIGFVPGVDGVYELTLTGLDAAGNGITTPGVPMLTVICNADGGVFQHVAMGAGTHLFPMTNDIDVELTLLGTPTPAATISVNRLIGDGAPAGLDATRLINEHIEITGSLNAATATVKWPHDPANALGLIGTIETVFQVEGGLVTGDFPATVDSGVIEFGPVTSFSEWWAGNQPSGVEDWMLMDLRVR